MSTKNTQVSKNIYIYTHTKKKLKNIWLKPRGVK